MMAVNRTIDLPFDERGLRGTLKLDEPLSRHTSWRVGGPADYFYVPADRQDVISLIKRLPPELPITWIGLGSNLLVRDGGVDGVVIKTSGALSAIESRDPGFLYAESGVSCAKVARVAIANGLVGAEFLAGVPGSFGGALVMNAGAFGGETWPLVHQIECIDRLGQCRRFDSKEIEFAYRSVKLPAQFAVLSATLKLKAADPKMNGRGQIKTLLEKRNASQPIQTANAGSVFKNPPGNFAAKIIEQLGLKGFALGGARFSEVHANFIINNGSATAAEIESLIDQAIGQAQTQLQVELEPEVRIIGRNP